MSFLRRLFEGEDVGVEALRPPQLGGDEAEAVGILTDSWRRFAAESVDPAAIDREHALGPGLLEGLRQMGLFGLVVPEEYGGGGLGATAYARVLEAVATDCASVAVTLGAHQSIGLKGLLLFGSDEQKRRWLPDLASGARIAGFALTEPNAGSDAGGIQTRARREAGGFRLSGSKQWITNGRIGGFFTVFARLPVEVGGESKDLVSAFLVPAPAPGLSVGPEEQKLGIRGSSTTALHLDDVVVGEGDLLGEPGKGFKIAMEILNEGRLGLAAGAVGGMKSALGHAARYAAQRRQFGRPIGEFDMIREKLAAMALETYAAESMVYATTAMVDAGERDFSLESAACKVFASEAAWRVADTALQVAGGYGYMEEYPYERILRDARINLIFEGTNEILRLYLAATALRGPGEVLQHVGEALRHPLSSIGVLSDFAARSIRRRVVGVRLEGVADGLEGEAKAFADLAGALGATAEEMLREWKKGILERELVLARLADAAVDLYAIAACLARASAATGTPDAEAHRELCRAFTAQALRRVRRALRSAEDSSATDEVRAISTRALEQGGYWLS